MLLIDLKIWFDRGPRHIFRPLWLLRKHGLPQPIKRKDLALIVLRSLWLISLEKAPWLFQLSIFRLHLKHRHFDWILLSFFQAAVGWFLSLIDPREILSFQRLRYRLDADWDWLIIRALHIYHFKLLKQFLLFFWCLLIIGLRIRILNLPRLLPHVLILRNYRQKERLTFPLRIGDIQVDLSPLKILELPLFAQESAWLYILMFQQIIFVNLALQKCMIIVKLDIIALSYIIKTICIYSFYDVEVLVI